MSGKTILPHYEVRIIRKDGSFGWVEMFTNMIEYYGKAALQSDFLDITERKRAEESLKESEKPLPYIILNRQTMPSYLKLQEEKSLMQMN